MKRHLSLALMSLTVALASCSALPNDPLNNPDQAAAEYLVILSLRSGDTPESLAARYRGEVIAFHQDAEYAIVATDVRFDPDQDQAIRSVSRNRDMTQSPVVQRDASGVNIAGTLVTSGGLTSWASGWNAWSGGWNAWSGGWNAWSGSSSVPLPAESNQKLWAMVGLSQANKLARKFGEGIKVAVIDTGVDLAHPGLQGRLVPSSEWRDYIDNDNNPQDAAASSSAPGASFGHGTAVAGIIAQIAPKAKILPLRVLKPDGSGNTDQVVRAVEYARSVGAQVMNLSLGSVQNDPALEQTIAYARDQGVFITSSVGNSGLVGGVTYPARNAPSGQTPGTSTQKRLMGVGSMNDRAVISTFSNRGGGVTVYAPGELVSSFYPGSRVGTFTGTSFAAPVVAGAYALAASDVTSPTDRARLAEILFNSLDTDISFGLNYQSPNGIEAGMLDIERLMYRLPGWTYPSGFSVPNLTLNPGFESGTTSWTLENATISTTKVRTGTRAMRLYSGVPNTYARVTQTFTNLTPNTTYSVVAWVRSDRSTYGMARVWLTPKGFSDNASLEYYTRSSFVPPDDTGYHPVSVRFTTGPNRTSASLEIATWNETAPVYIDDVALMRLGQ